MPFWKRMLMPVSEHPWVDAEAHRRPPEWYSYNYGSVRPNCAGICWGVLCCLR